MKFFVKLGTALLSILEKIKKARFIIMSMTGNSYFPSPSPTMATLAKIANELEAAMIKAKSAGKEATAAMYYKEEELDLALRQLVGYVETVANQNPGIAETIILSAGLDMRSKRSRELKDFDAFATGKPGEVKMLLRGVSRGAYEFQMCTDLSNEANWRTINMGTSGRFTMTNLAPGWYHFRGRTIVKGGPTPWSDAKSVYVIK